MYTSYVYIHMMYTRCVSSDQMCDQLMLKNVSCVIDVSVSYI